MIFRFFALLLGILLVAACVSTKDTNPYTETSAVCDQAGLDSQLEDFRDGSNSLKGALGVGTENWGVVGSYEQNNIDVDRQYVLQNKMRMFDAEVDAQFRNVTSSCKAFSRCMEMNRYDEGKCRSTMNRWNDAEREFRGLAVDLRELSVEVERIRSKPDVVIKKDDRCKDDCCGKNCRPPEPPRSEACCDTIGNIFTDCCG